MTTVVLVLTLILRVSTLPEFQAAQNPRKTLDNPPDANETESHCQPIGMVCVTHGTNGILGCLECTGFPYACLFFVQLEQKPSGSVFDGLTNYLASNKKHVVHTVLSTLLNNHPQYKSLRGNDVRRIYTRNPAQTQYPIRVKTHGLSGHSARAPPASQSVRVPSFFVQ